VQHSWRNVFPGKIPAESALTSPAFSKNALRPCGATLELGELATGMRLRRGAAMAFAILFEGGTVAAFPDSTSMSAPIQTLPGFRDFFPEDCAVRNYIIDKWQCAARRYGFVEYDGPALEATDLYTRKSGSEITTQLFAFTDKGGREVSLRPEVTPSLARMAAARQRDFKKPMKWHQIGPCYRFEKPQRGRGREFLQFNCDILGEAGEGADAELIAMAVDVMRDFGFGPDDFTVRLSDRRAWNEFATAAGVAEDRIPDFLHVIDKLEREKPEATEAKLNELGLSLAAVREFIGNPDKARQGVLGRMLSGLEARGAADYVRVDLGIVRGLAYYTGVVFEVFDLRGELRAVAGGGRYDNLCKLIGGVDLPAVGFAMGDMVLREFIEATPQAKSRLMTWQRQAHNLDVYVVVADESRRGDALGVVQRLREAGVRTDFPLAAAKVGRQFQAAELWNARAAVVIGAEFPRVQLKCMATRQESAVDAADVPAKVRELLAAAPLGPLLADGEQKNPAGA
jgi:histidyl-tRNA synthetase